MQQQNHKTRAHTRGDPARSDMQYLLEDLRTPVVMIAAYARIIRHRIERELDLDPRDLLEHLDVIERSTRRLDARLRAAERQASGGQSRRT